jgi:hypothetical protein
MLFIVSDILMSKPIMNFSINVKSFQYEVLMKETKTIANMRIENKIIIKSNMIEEKTKQNTNNQK